GDERVSLVELDFDSRLADVAVVELMILIDIDEHVALKEACCGHFTCFQLFQNWARNKLTGEVLRTPRTEPLHGCGIQVERARRGRSARSEKWERRTNKPHTNPRQRSSPTRDGKPIHSLRRIHRERNGKTTKPRPGECELAGERKTEISIRLLGAES